MKPLSQRRAFVIFMTAFATPFVIAISRLKLGQQADQITDSLKIGLLIAVSTAFISFCVWTLLHRNKGSKLRGAIAGLVSAFLIIPIPAAIWTLKTETLNGYQERGESIFEAAFFSIPNAIHSGLYTFIDITKAALMAVVASMILGVIIAHYLPARSKA